jgi:hypothetical protein
MPPLDALLLRIWCLRGALPRLQEVMVSRDVVNAILACPSLGGRPLQEVIMGFKLSGKNSAS